MTAGNAEDIRHARGAVAAAARRAFESGLQTNIGGNLSVRLPAMDAILVKPSGVGFAECDAGALVVVNGAGEVVEGRRKPSQDTAVHLAVYRARPDIDAIMHVHSPYATGWASAGRPVPLLTFQAREKMGRLPLVPTAPGGGQQTERELVAVFEDPAVFAATLENHGTFCAGGGIARALHLAELVEETAHIAFVSQLLAAGALRG